MGKAVFKSREDLSTYGNLTSSKSLSSDVDYAVLGIPFDIRTSYRPGTRFGPMTIRDCFGTDDYNEAVGIRPSDYVKGIDYGDLDMENAERVFLTDIPDTIEKIAKAGIVPVTLGGDHAIAFPELMGYKAAYGKVAMVHFDSHTDTWGKDEEDVPKQYHTHGNPFRRAIQNDCLDTEHSIQVGMRGPLMNEHDFDFADSHGLTHVSAEKLHAMGIDKAASMIKEKVGDAKVMITFDIDFVDPAFAPGTGTPVPGGFTSREALELVRQALIGLNIVGCDLVEVAPNYDESAVTAMLASRLIKEFITCLACKKAGIKEYARKGMRLHE